jgi:hypothetical protein
MCSLLSFDASSLFVGWNAIRQMIQTYNCFPPIVLAYSLKLEIFFLDKLYLRKCQLNFWKNWRKTYFCFRFVLFRCNSDAKGDYYCRKNECLPSNLRGGDAFNKLSVEKLLRFNAKKKIFLIMKQTRFYQLFQTKSFCVFVLQNKNS